MSTAKERWEEIPTEDQDNLLEWFNQAGEPDDEDLEALCDLYESGRFYWFDCAECKTRVRHGDPDDYGHFQGVNDDEHIGQLCADCGALYLHLKTLAEE